MTGAAIIKETQDSFQKGLSFFTDFLLIFAVVALVVGSFVILNTFAITVAQRTRENGLLRALGASRRQVLRSVLIEAVAIGLIASLIGLAAGVAIAIGLKALLGALGLGLPGGAIVFSARTVVVSLLAGLAVTIVAAVSPARKAAKVPPVAAMQDVTVGSTGYGSKQRVIVGIAILALGVAALFTGLFGHVASAFLVVGAGVLLVFLGVSVLGRTIALPLSRIIGAPLPRLRGVTGSLARENAMRNPKRTAASASALMIGVGLVGFITIFAASAKASVNASIDRTLAGDMVIDSGAGMAGGGVDPGLAQRLNALPQVAAATGVRNGAALILGKVEQITAVDPQAGSKILAPRWRCRPGARCAPRACGRRSRRAAARAPGQPASLLGQHRQQEVIPQVLAGRQDRHDLPRLQGARGALRNVQLHRPDRDGPPLGHSRAKASTTPTCHCRGARTPSSTPSPR